MFAEAAACGFGKWQESARVAASMHPVERRAVKCSSMAIDVFNLAAIVLVWVAAALAAFALLGDALAQRVKRLSGTARKRCPKCWYDLSQTAAGDAGHVTCSECGYRVRRERQLYRGRRRWGLVALAMLLLLGSYAVHVTPGVRERGMVAAVPTTGLILALPWIESMHDLLAEELLEHRADPSVLWPVQEWLLVERCLRGDQARRPISEEWLSFYGLMLHELKRNSPQEPYWLGRAEALVEVNIRTRPTWPVGIPLYGQWSLDRWNQHAFYDIVIEPLDHGLASTRVVAEPPRAYRFDPSWSDHRILLGTPDSSSALLRYRAEVSIGDFDLRSHDVHVPIRFVASVDDVLEPVSSTLVEDWLAGELRPVLIGYEGSDEFAVQLWKKWSLYGIPDEVEHLTFAFRIEVICSAEVVGEAFAWFEFESGAYPAFSAPVRLDWRDEKKRVFSRDEKWTVRLCGDANTALRNIDSDRYWSGDIERPLRLDVRGRP